MAYSSRYRGFLVKWAILRKKEKNREYLENYRREKYEEFWKLHPFELKGRLWQMIIGDHQFSSVQSLSRVRLFATPWIAARHSSLSINSRSSRRLMSIKSVMPSSPLILCCPLLLLPPIPPSVKVFTNESTLHMMWPKYWSFSFSIIPSKEIPGLISFRMDWLDLLAVQGTVHGISCVSTSLTGPYPVTTESMIALISCPHSSDFTCSFCFVFLHHVSKIKWSYES